MIDWPFKLAFVLFMASLLCHGVERHARKRNEVGVYHQFYLLTRVWAVLALVCVLIEWVML